MTTYPTNPSDSQWQIISKYLDVSRNRKYDLREIVNAILYVIWRMLPKDFAPWKSVYYYFSVWKKKEIFEMIDETWVEKIRIKQGKKEEPTVRYYRCTISQINPCKQPR